MIKFVLTKNLLLLPSGRGRGSICTWIRSCGKIRFFVSFLLVLKDMRLLLLGKCIWCPLFQTFMTKYTRTLNVHDSWSNRWRNTIREKRRTICETQIASATGRVYVIITDYLWDGILKLLHFSTVSTKWAPWNSVILQCKSRLASCALTWQAIRATASGWFNFNPRASRFWARNPVWWIRSPSSSRGLSLMTKNSWIRS